MTLMAVFMAIGAVIGGLWGRFRQYGNGDCPPATNWKRGAIYGAVMGLAGYFAFGNSIRPYQPPQNIKAISEADFETEVTRAGRPVVLDFYAPWCGPCKILSPRLDALAGEFGERIKFVSINLDHAPGLANRFNVQAIPTLLFFDEDGRVADRIIGLASSSSLRSKLESISTE